MTPLDAVLAEAVGVTAAITVLAASRIAACVITAVAGMIVAVMYAGMTAERLIGRMGIGK